MDIIAFLQLLPILRYHDRFFFGIDEVLTICTEMPEVGRSIILRRILVGSRNSRGVKFVYAVHTGSRWIIKKGKVLKSYRLFIERSLVIQLFIKYMQMNPDATPRDYLRPIYVPCKDDSGDESWEQKDVESYRYLRFMTETLLITISLGRRSKELHDKIEELVGQKM